MLDSIVARDSLIELRSAFRQNARTQQGSAHEAMPNHERDRRPLLLGEGEELLGKIARDIAIEHHRVRDPKAVEDGEQQQRVFRALSERFGSPDQQMCSLRNVEPSNSDPKEEPQCRHRSVDGAWRDTARDQVKLP
jgi:hypothetical protein